MKAPHHQILFVCGTDTGVGKTLVTGSLLLHLNHVGIRAGGFKPLESGCQSPLRRHLHRADALFLKESGAMNEPLSAINPYAFREPLAPGIAAEREKRKVSFLFIQKTLNRLKKKYRVILIEGAGGLLVPLSGKKTNLDLIKALKAPVLLVARLGLGTINHTLLTLECLKKNGIDVKGVILNQTTPEYSIAEKTNPEVLKRFGAPLWGVFPHLKIKSKEALRKVALRLNRVPG